jgi:hypothetical protein
MARYGSWIEWSSGLDAAGSVACARSCGRGRWHIRPADRCRREGVPDQQRSRRQRIRRSHHLEGAHRPGQEGRERRRGAPGCRRNFSSATGPAMPPKACKSTALSARKPTPRCADFNTPCRSTFPRSRWTASSARYLAGPGRRHAVGLAAPTAICRLASARVPRRAKTLLVQRKNRGGTIIHRRRLPFRWGHVVGDFNGEKVFRSSAAVVCCCGVCGYVGSRLNRGNDRKIRTLIATGRRRGRHIASLLAVNDRARARLARRAAC